MFNKRRAREADGDLDHTLRPWPVLQRRKIEKLKDERLREFERACGENFEWLENYYQGCVFAALQNRNYEDGHNGLNLSTASYPEEPTHVIPQSLGHDGDDVENSAPQDYDRDSMRTPTTSKRRTRDSHSYAGRGILTESLHHSHNRRSRSKQHSNQFLLKSPKTPILSSPMRTPRSPYERRRITPKRRRLRVDASAATRKAQRALRALRKRSNSYPESMEGDRRRDKRPSRQSSETESSSWQHPGRRSSSGRKQAEMMHQPHASTPHKKARPDSVAVPKDSALASNDHSTITTPVRLPLNRVHSTTTPGQDYHSRRTDGMEVEVAVERKTTPGSRARDSMVLISPYSRPRSSSRSRERDINFSSTPDLTRGSSAVSRTTRMAMEMDIDIDANDNDIEIDEADYKRPRSSSFQDSIAPVRFGSPDADGDKRQTQSANVGKEARMEGKSTRTSKGSLLLEDDDLLRDIVENSLLRRSTAKDPSRRPSAPPSSTTPKHPPEAEYRAFRNETGVGSDAGQSKWALGVDTGDGDGAHSNGTYSRHRSIQDTSMIKIDTMDHTDGAFESSMNNADRSSRHDRPNHSTSHSGPTKQDKTEMSRRAEQQERLEASMNDNTDYTGNPGAAQTGPSSSVASTVRMQDVSSSDSVLARSRAPATLPEKRTIGTRRPVTQQGSTQGQQQPVNKMPPSRLTKLTMASSLATTSGASPKPVHSFILRQFLEDNPPAGRVQCRLDADFSTVVIDIHTSDLKPPKARTPSRTSSIRSSQRRWPYTVRESRNFVVPQATPDLKINADGQETCTTSAANRKARKEVQGQGQQSKTTDLSATESGQNPFLVPAAIRPTAVSARAKQREKTILPDIGSDGESDDLPMNVKSSADKDQQLPAWASWEALRRAMEAQRHLNPQDIFGPLPALDMAEMFPGRELRLRQRTSASHWTADRLTAQEVMKYNKEMGWASGPTSRD
ncbi:hypothetical protein BGZ70_007631 [Mortierella alpina]|uniref:Inner centromere protein ARK-binding domain-containing protein n=1 Tax=Mortierella alpina TaxID=64518 RepID=A0A9P6J5C0_MORAP|nr:hypothetical protein BGZ70_007631 [Mortierella alpina]